jgi:hypothetical protein
MEKQNMFQIPNLSFNNTHHSKKNAHLRLTNALRLHRHFLTEIGSFARLLCTLHLHSMASMLDLRDP